MGDLTSYAGGVWWGFHSDSPKNRKGGEGFYREVLGHTGGTISKKKK